MNYIDKEEQPFQRDLRHRSSWEYEDSPLVSSNQYHSKNNNSYSNRGQNNFHENHRTPRKGGEQYRSEYSKTSYRSGRRDSPEYDPRYEKQRSPPPHSDNRKNKGSYQKSHQKRVQYVLRSRVSSRNSSNSPVRNNRGLSSQESVGYGEKYRSYDPHTTRYTPENYRYEDRNDAPRHGDRERYENRRDRMDGKDRNYYNERSETQRNDRHHNRREQNYDERRNIAAGSDSDRHDSERQKRTHSPVDKEKQVNGRNSKYMDPNDINFENNEISRNLDENKYSTSKTNQMMSDETQNHPVKTPTETIDAASQTDIEESIDTSELQQVDENWWENVPDEEELEQPDIYLCYMMTEKGAIVGPFRLDVDNITLGLPEEVEGGINDASSKKLSKDSKSNDTSLRNRQSGSHGLNEFSSRSHSMLQLSISSETQDNDDENLYITKRGKLTFVDLAGSEKVKESGASAEQLIESNNINKSLLVLGNCISSLGDSKKRHGHIPYRDSKLTKLLADSLGGNGVTLMITCITPSSHHLSETMNTLRYASRTKKIVTKPVIKLDPREKLILSLKREIKVLRNENHYLRQQLEFPDKPKGGIQKTNDQNFVKHVKDQIKDKPNNENKSNGANNPSESSLYEMLQEYMVENEAIRSENSELNSTKDRIRREQQLLSRENEKLMKRVEELERVVTASPTAWNNDANTPKNSYANQRKSLAGKADDGQKNVPKGRNPPVAARGHPMKPPHRLSDSVTKSQDVNGYESPLEQGYSSPRRRPSNGSFKPANGTSRENSIRSMNEKLKQELHSIDYEIDKHEMIQRRSQNSYAGAMTYR